MTTSKLFNYDADARDRLRELLERQNVSFLDQLRLSIDSAGTCLELCTPGVMGSSIDDKRRLFAGPAVLAAPYVGSLPEFPDLTSYRAAVAKD